MSPQSTITLRSGNKMPIMGLGTWQLNKDTAQTVAHALRLGYRMIDTSGDYGTQPGIGEGIRLSDISREKLYITTKVEEYEDAYEAAAYNLKELQLAYADLILIHRPPGVGVGESLWKGLIRAKADGLTRDIGVSNYGQEQIEHLIEATGEVPVVNQIEWTPLGHSRDMLEFCRQQGIVIQAYSPLTRTKRFHDPELDDIARAHGKTAAQVLLRWNLQMGTVPLPKANKLEHLEENLQIFDFELSQDEMHTLGSMNQHYSSLGKLPYVP